METEGLNNRQKVVIGLNNRQKVVISFMMGRFVQETIQVQLRSIEKSMMEMHDHPPGVGG